MCVISVCSFWYLYFIWSHLIVIKTQFLWFICKSIWARRIAFNWIRLSTLNAVVHSSSTVRRGVARVLFKLNWVWIVLKQVGKFERVRKGHLMQFKLIDKLKRVFDVEKVERRRRNWFKTEKSRGDEKIERKRRNWEETEHSKWSQKSEHLKKIQNYKT